jgi:hypothetical protein
VAGVACEFVNAAFVKNNVYRSEEDWALSKNIPDKHEQK